MACFKFARAILAGEPIPVFNHGHMSRDFTYIDDIVDGVLAVLDRPAPPAWPSAANAESTAPYRVLQHRQPRAGAAAGLHRRAGARARPTRAARPASRCSPATCPPPTPT